MRQSPIPPLDFETASAEQLAERRTMLQDRISRGQLLIRMSTLPMAWVALGAQVRKFKREVRRIDRRLAELQAEGEE